MKRLRTWSLYLTSLIWSLDKVRLTAMAHSYNSLFENYEPPLLDQKQNKRRHHNPQSKTQGDVNVDANNINSTILNAMMNRATNKTTENNNIPVTYEFETVRSITKQQQHGRRRRYTQQLHRQQTENYNKNYRLPSDITTTTSAATDDDVAVVDYYQPLRMSFDTSALSSVIQKNGSHKNRVQSITDVILPAAARTWSSLLSVKPVENIQINERVCFGKVSVPEHMVRNGVEGTDLVIFVQDGGSHCHVDSNMMGFAYPCALDEFNDRPMVGIIFFCFQSFQTDSSTNDMTSESIRKITDLAIHEIGHILGVNSALFPYFRDATTGEPLTPRPLQKRNGVTCANGNVRDDVILPSGNTMRGVITSSGLRYFMVVTPRVATVVRNQFNCQSLTGARLENHPTNDNDCFGSHWDERLFYTESMGAIFGERTNILSPLTLALLEDSGWYRANYQASQISTFGHGAGCDFVTKPCIVNDKVPPYADDFFCDTPLMFDARGETIIEARCDVTFHHVMACDLVDRKAMGEEVEEIPKEFQYFSNPNLGPVYASKQADYCPMPSLFVYSCSDTSRRPSVRGETFGTSQRCFNFKMMQISGLTTNSAFCLESYCDDVNHRLLVVVFGEEYHCEYDGQVHMHPGYHKHIYPGYRAMYFVCPRLAVVCPNMLCPANCSGRGVCNFSGLKPRCHCFDDNDTSSGCFGNFTGHDDASSNNATMSHIITPPPTRMITAAPTPSPTYSNSEILLFSRTEGPTDEYVGKNPLDHQPKNVDTITTPTGSSIANDYDDDSVSGSEYEIDPLDHWDDHPNPETVSPHSIKIRPPDDEASSSSGGNGPHQNIKIWCDYFTFLMFSIVLHHV